MPIPAISPERAHRKVKNEDALLVCAYDDARKCEGFQLEDSIPLASLNERANTLTKNQNIIFFCD